MKRFSVLIANLIIVLVLGFGAAAAWFASAPGPLDFARPASTTPAYAGPAVTGVPAELARADVVTRGQYLERAAECEGCHTAPGGQAFAGGRPFQTAYGTIYSTNITPDRATGIGAWSDRDFLSAVHKGVRPDGQHLYPAFPYATYAHMADADVLAIKAYLFSLKPVRHAASANDLVFPLDHRWLMGVWSLIFDRDGAFQPVAGRSSEWNRGAYLSEAMAHCGECHTPRTVLQSLDNRKKFAGGVASGWNAYNITSDRLTGVGAWSDQELAQYIAAGHAEGRGSAAGPMGDAVDLGMRFLTPADVHAMVVYLRSLPAIGSSNVSPSLAGPAPASPKENVPVIGAALGKRIFEGACASCHGWTGAGQLTSYAGLTGSRAVNDPSAVNVARVVLSGSRRRTPQGEVFMPAFGHAYSDAEIAAVANYVTGRFGAQPSRLTADDVAGMRGD
jgi:mono/diheme cytochrome c family protein